MSKIPLDSLVKIAQIVQGLLTPAIAVLIGVVTFRIQRQQAKTQQQQAATNHLQYRLALMDRRMKVFDSTLEFIALVLGEAKIETVEPLFKLLRETRGHPFLFGAEIGEYIDELYKKGNRLRSIYSVRSSAGVIRPEDISADTEINMWFSGQTAVATEKFLKYLDFRKP